MNCGGTDGTPMSCPNRDHLNDDMSRINEFKVTLVKTPVSCPNRDHLNDDMSQIKIIVIYSGSPCLLYTPNGSFTV